MSPVKAAVYSEYGPPEVLRLQEVPRPTPKADEVLIKVRATTVTSGDVNVRGFVFVPPGFGPLPRLMFGLRRPKKRILGIELAGDVQAVGDDVTEFKAGDRVFGMDSAHLGAYAEYACRPADGPLVSMPNNLSYEEAAAVPFGATTALYFLKDVGRVQSGQKVLVNGASGGVGTYAVQIAKYYGAHVTGVCSTANLELVTSLGADEVIDYTKEDFTTSGETYDVIVDTVVGKTSFLRCKGSLTPNGRYVAVAGGLKEVMQTLRTAVGGGKKVLVGMPPVGENKETLMILKDLLEAGNLRPVIDRRYRLEEIVEAHRYVDKGHKRGSVVISVAADDAA